MSHCRRLRAPTEDGAALIDPPLTETPAVMRRNRELAMEFDRRAGFAAGYRAAARQQLVSQVGLSASGADAPLILSGHQPELFHPGVWFKNFLLSAIAESVSGTGINLIIDNDAIRSPGIRVPRKGGALPEVVVVPFDATAEELPWEQRKILNAKIFQDFLGATKNAVAPLLNNREFAGGMVLDRLWPQAIAAAVEQEALMGVANLGQCLARARHGVEQELGLTTFELPLSEIASGEHFLHFAAVLIERHLEFYAAHNAALAEYRLTHRIRSQTHPVPELARDGEWHEMPLWLWTAENPRRRAVFVRLHGNGWQLTDRLGVELDLAGSDPLGIRAFSSLLSGRGIKIRPRALVTTMYARLVLSDLFIHGIGGAKYDELTDAIIRRFFGVEPPGYVTATATFRLPMERPNVSPEDVRQSARRMRGLRYRPESFVNDALVFRDSELRQKLAALADEKRAYLDQHDLRRCSPQVFARLDALNRAMHELLQPVEEKLRARHAELIALSRQTQLLASREFSFVLFPFEKLPAQLLALSRTIS
jgi:hypothetical protein